MGNNQNRSLKFFAVAALVVTTVVVLIFPAIVPEALSPVEKCVRCVRTAIGSRVRGALRGASACAENVRLRREMASLALLVGEVDRLEAENARLRRTLGYREQQRHEWMPAAVLSVDGGAVAPGDLLRVDKGSESGVVDGAVVIVPEGLVGRVVDTTPHTAQIRLITDPRVKVACMVMGPDGEERGILAGGSDERIVLKYFHPSAALPANSKVMTSGRGGVFPAGIAIGDYLGVNDQGVPGVRPAVDFSTLEDVFIHREK